MQQLQNYVFILLETLQQPIIFYVFIGILGLIVGSFLNVVIYRLPKMLEREWYQQSVHYLLELKNQGYNLSDYDVEDKTVEITVHTRAHPKPILPFNLFLPGSHCPQCHSPVAAWHNIPLLSYILLRGRCATCENPISPRYPIIELVTMLLSLVVAYYFGFSIQTFAGLIFTWLLIALAIIDMETQLLPDTMTLFGLWLGLLCSLFYVFISPQQAIIGAIVGYLSLWLIYWIFKFLTHKEGMGYGDFKLFALAGAWMGWTSLPLTIFMASLTGAIWGIAALLLGINQRENPIPFGPFLALSAWLSFVFGDQIVSLYLHWIY